VDLNLQDVRLEGLRCWCSLCRDLLVDWKSLLRECSTCVSWLPSYCNLSLCSRLTKLSYLGIMNVQYDLVFLLCLLLVSFLCLLKYSCVLHSGSFFFMPSGGKCLEIHETWEYSVLFLYHEVIWGVTLSLEFSEAWRLLQSEQELICFAAWIKVPRKGRCWLGLMFETKVSVVCDWRLVTLCV
jgi:hypothetical protein